MDTSKTSLKLQRTDSDGFILIAVLWILGALSVLASIYAVYVINTASAFATYDDHLKAEALVSAALELTAYRQQAAAQLRPTHGRFEFRLGKESAVVQYRSEDARIDLNKAPKQLLAGLFVALGASPDDANVYADRIIGWRTTPSNKQDSEALAYRMAGFTYEPREAAFPHVNELSLVRDLPMPLVERALPFVTVYSGRAQVNVLEAAPEVIAALPGMSKDLLDTFLAQRRASPGNAELLLPLLKDARQYVTVAGSKTLRVTVRITFDNGHREKAEVVILLFDKGDQPFAVLSWRDPFDQTIADNGL
ncbi:MAG: type II secretion system protein GspK [Pseudolabrys sp.]